MKKKILAVILSVALIGAAIFGILYLKEVSEIIAETERLILRRYKKEDAQDLYEY